MKRALISILLLSLILIACGNDNDINIGKIAQAISTCGGSTPCNCGDTLTATRTLDSSDSLQDCATPVALYINIPNGGTLNCNGDIISALPSSFYMGTPNYNNTQTGIKILSNNVIIRACNVVGFLLDADAQGRSNLIFFWNNWYVGNDGSNDPAAAILIGGQPNLSFPQSNNVYIYANNFYHTDIARTDQFIAIINASNVYVSWSQFFDINLIGEIGVKIDPPAENINISFNIFKLGFETICSSPQLCIPQRGIFINSVPGLYNPPTISNLSHNSFYIKTRLPYGEPVAQAISTGVLNSETEEYDCTNNYYEDWWGNPISDATVPYVIYDRKDDTSLAILDWNPRLYH